MKVCLAGSRALELNGTVAQHVLNTLLSLPRETETILLRSPLHSPPRPFEALVASLAEVLGLGVDWWVPEPGGRSQVYLRDISMVSAADEIITFFPEGDEMMGGTGHVVDMAIAQEKTCRAYAVVGSELVLIGSDEGSTADILRP